MTCQICGSKTYEIMDFGRMPIANRFINPGEGEYFYNLRLMRCEFCEMVQLDEQPPAELMFNQDYPFFTSSSQYMTNHFNQFASQIRPDKFVVEIGSNDGTFLDNFPNHAGVEPSKSAHDKAIARGVNSINKFFTDDVVYEIIDTHGHADVIYAANCMCHIKDINSVLRGVRKLLKPDGLFIFEDPYLGDIAAGANYDQIYDEHFYYFSIDSVDKMLSINSIHLLGAMPLPVHGGSMRYTCGFNTNGRIAGLGDKIDMSDFKERVDNRAKAFTEKVRSYNGDIIGYAATSKSTTVLNYCGLGPGDIEYILDSTPEKWGLMTPGSHITIYEAEAHSIFEGGVILLAPNHEEEIKAKHPEFKGEWIKY